MSAVCTAERRDRCRKARVNLAALDVVVDVDVLSPQEGHHHEWTVSAVVTGRAVPPMVLEALADEDLDLDPDATGSRGDPLQVEILARI